MSNNTNEINKKSWDEYQDDYMRFQLMKRPWYYDFFQSGGVNLDDFLVSMIGDVNGLKLLDTCCACDATQAFSCHNLGARVTACDITPSAIRIAKENASKMNLELDFIVDDMQILSTVNDNEFDIVFATYPVWLSDINTACRTWHRVLKKGGRLLLHAEHPITYCMGASDGNLVVERDYNNQATIQFERFTGTPLADLSGGWSVDLPSVENFYRISDLINAICQAGFRVLEAHESNATDDDSVMRNLPADFAVLAIK